MKTNEKTLVSITKAANEKAKNDAGKVDMYKSEYIEHLIYNGNAKTHVLENNDTLSDMFHEITKIKEMIMNLQSKYNKPKWFFQG